MFKQKKMAVMDAVTCARIHTQELWAVNHQPCTCKNIKGNHKKMRFSTKTGSFQHLKINKNRQGARSYYLKLMLLHCSLHHEYQVVLQATVVFRTQIGRTKSPKLGYMTTDILQTTPNASKHSLQDNYL